MSLQDEIRQLINTDSAAHKRVIEYVVRQIHTGRDLEAILDDPYVTNRLGHIDRRALLEEPDVVHAAGEQALAELRARLDRLAGA